MNLINGLFISLSVITLLCAIMVVFSKNPIYSVLYLILTMFGITGHYVLLHAQFIAVVNIIVYAGAIMVLFLSVLMLLNMSKDNEPNKSMKWKLSGSLLGILAMGILGFIFEIKMTKNCMPHVAIAPDFGYVKPLGKLLFTEYVFPFEVASILFIAAMVGVVFLATKDQSVNNK